MKDDGTPSLLHLRRGTTSVVLDHSGTGVARVAYWGADLGATDEGALGSIVLAGAGGRPHSGLDGGWPVTLLPTEADGWSGRPGLSGSRDEAGLPLRLATESVELTEEQDAAVVTLRATDADAGLAVSSELRLERTGLVRVRHAVTNTAASRYVLAGLTAALPVPAQEAEVLDLSGRWCRERSPQRRPFHDGAWVRESRRGRTGHDATLLLLVGEPGFGFRHGEVRAAHVAWSGWHAHAVERLPEGVALLSGGELLAPGEIVLGSGQTYTSPWVLFAHSAEGMDGISRQLHGWVRSRPGHPRSPRPLTLNTWEAVYFDHDLGRLNSLAERAASIGVERFVLDDGWFLGRRDDTVGLGDWVVDPEVWPEGLAPLFDRVRELGMSPGLWVEPEMVNPGSKLALAHPDWLLAAPGRPPRLWRNQHVLDLVRPEAWEHVLEQLDAVVTAAHPDYLKWDHNRDLLEAWHTGRPAVHAQTEAVYRLLDELRRLHPGLEIESCASGGARADLGILQHTDRVWASDTNDPIERTLIQRWTGLLLPPELVGAHVGPERAHTTGRATSLAMRTATALFGHAGLELDLVSCSDSDLAALGRWSALYRELRGLLHSGDVVRADLPDSGAVLHGVVSPGLEEALFCYSRLTTGESAQAPTLRLPGLDRRTYVVDVREEAGAVAISGSPPPWLAAARRGEPLRLPGAALATAGLAAPNLQPGEALLIHLRPDAAAGRA